MDHNRPAHTHTHTPKDYNGFLLRWSHTEYLVLDLLSALRLGSPRRQHAWIRGHSIMAVSTYSTQGYYPRIGLVSNLIPSSTFPSQVSLSSPNSIPSSIKPGFWCAPSRQALHIFSNGRSSQCRRKGAQLDWDSTSRAEDFNIRAKRIFQKYHLNSREIV